MASVDLLPRDVLSHVLAFLESEKDAAACDTVSRAWQQANADGAWKAFVTRGLLLRDEHKKGYATWRALVQARVVPTIRLLREVCKAPSPKTRVTPWGKSTLQSIYARYETLPIDAAVGLGLMAHFNLTTFGQPLASTPHHISFDSSADTNEFLYIGAPGMGGGDTQWWMFLQLQGQVSCPRAPRDYCHDRRRGEKETFGAGAVVVFSHWNHGGAATDAKHVPPEWGVDSQEEFGCEAEFEENCDEWIRVNLEHPVGAGGDSPGCAWPSFTAFLQSIPVSMREFRQGEHYRSMLNKAERIELWAGNWMCTLEEAEKRLFPEGED